MTAVTSADAVPGDLYARQQLAGAVRDRRLELGISVRAAAAQASVGRDTWIGLEDATRRTADTKYASIERTLHWAPGSIKAVLGGGEPTKAEPAAGTATGGNTFAASPSLAAQGPHPADGALIRVMRSTDLTDQQKANIVRQLIAEQERYADRRAAELIEQARAQNG